MNRKNNNRACLLFWKLVFFSAKIDKKLVFFHEKVLSSPKL